METDKFKNNRAMKYLLEEYFDNDRKRLAAATHKSASTVEFWFRTKPKAVGLDTLELLLYKIKKGNKKIDLPDHLLPESLK
ncbi:hypothetical protein [Moritella sp. F3]|uniref:hypothetical protein n=1 Tax=Moritella sp. F3 TaxID=2718882 RepID=UPI0018E123D2|nr:hypothetical protein [Moritella sp. F3]GIC77648.1 hypothetical protein FMO001_23750 [Moritella sp. F1]GIC82061.1 hypothetical protein FMO003_23420 [Moritella sp. F3]